VTGCRYGVMRCTTSRLTVLAACSLVAVLLAASGATGLCPAEPNVVFLVDTSGSMANVTWHPGFDPGVPTSCIDFTSPLQLLSDQAQSHCGTVRTYRVDPALEAQGIRTRFDPRYLNWLHDLPNGHPFLAEIAAPDSGTEPACLGGGSYAAYQESRLTAAQRFVRDVACQVTAAGNARFGLARLRVASDPAGGYLAVPVDENSAVQAAMLDAGIADLAPTGWGPLGESLFHVYTYAMSRTSFERPFGIDGVTRFPGYTYGTDGNPSVSPPPSPMSTGCQEHLVVVLADDAPTRDDFDPGGTGSEGFSDFSQLIGNYNPDDVSPEAGDEEPGVSPTCTSGCEVALYLDDIALFMHERDFRTDLTGVQRLRVFSVAFGIDPFAWDLLAKTADVGGGLFLLPQDAETLADEILAANAPPPVPAFGVLGQLVGGLAIAALGARRR